MSIGGATYDLFVHVPHEIMQDCEGRQSFTLPLGEKVKVKDVLEKCGGGASNTSVGLSRLGCDACFSGVLSSDQWGSKLFEKLSNEGVDTDCITVVDGEVSSFSIVLIGNTGERVILYDPGTNAHLHDVTFDRKHAESMDWVYFNHIQEASCVIEDDIIELLAHDHPQLTWNPGGCQLDEGIKAANNVALLKHTNLLLLNKEEAARFTKTDDVNEAIRILLDAGVENVCITDGGRGTTASDGTNVYHCPVVPDNKVIDSTGAGDAFGTGVTWGLVSGLDLPNALRAGTINAASVVGAVGAQTGLLTDIEMNERLKNTHLDVESKTL